MDFKELSTKLAALTDDKIDLSTKLNAATSENERLTADLSARDETITTLTTERDDLKTQLEAANNDEGGLNEDQTTALNTLIGKQYVALKALDGDTDAKVLEDVPAMVDFITGNETRLSALIPAGGASQGAGSDESDEDRAKREAETKLKAQADSFRS